MLPYVKTAVTEVLSGNSSLTVFARGLDLEALVAVVAANKLTHSEERPVLALNFPKPVFQRFCQTLAAHPAKFPLHLLPRHISSSLSAVERNEVYRCGGVVSATPRTFAVDILQAISKLRDPAETNLKPVNYLGVLLFNAHEITDCRSEAFVVRLFQEYVCIRDLQNTFIFAFSDSAQVLSRGFHTAEKLMRLLGLERLLLFPRFHVDVITSLEYDQNPCDRLEPTHLTDAPIQGGTIELLEIHQPMTALMKAIYDEIWALIRVCFSELRKSAPGLDLDESDLRGSRSNTNLLQTAQRLSQAWRHLNSRARQLLLDIQCLYRILICLLNDDCVTFLSYLESIREVHGSGSYWLMMERAQNMYLLSKERVFHGSLQHEEHVQEVLRSLSTRQSSAKVRDLLEISKKLDLTPEPNSKWMLLRDLLDEIINSMRNAGNPSGSAYLPGFRILVLGREPNTMKFLSDFLGGGESPKCALLRKFIRYLEVQGAMRNLHRPSTSRNPEALALDATENGNQSSSSSSSDHSDAVEDSDSCAKGQRTGASWRVNPHEDSSEGLREMPPLDTDSYASNDRDYRPWSQQDTNLSTNESALKFEILLKAYGRGNANTRTGNLIGPSTVLPFLMEIQPCAVILLDPTLQHVREIEVYQAAYSRYSKIRMYTIFYEDSFEYEQYRKTVADEQQAFQTLIRHKASMAVRLDQSLEPSRAGDCSRMMTRWQQSDSHMLAEQSSESSRHSRILVDIREFRSSIPGSLYQHGFELRPRTLKAGDYVLSPDICVERKTISDLISSLASGRLYMQCQAMCQKYRYPILMIELSEDDVTGQMSTFEGLGLHVSYYSDETSMQYKHANGIGKLCLLTIHFPRLRLIWCRGPQAAAEAFQTLKHGEVEPEEEASADPAVEAKDGTNNPVGTDNMSMMNPRDNFALRPFDMLRCLPAVENANVFALMRHFRNLSEFANAETEDIAGILGSALAKRITSFISLEFSGPLTMSNLENQVAHEFNKS